MSDASVITLVGASRVGCTSSEALARACLTLLKAVVVSSVHSSASEGCFVVLRTE